VFLAPGFEQTNTATIVDILRRCSVKVVVAGLLDNAIEGAHGISFNVDTSIDKLILKDFDAVICPGGDPGYKNLRKSSAVLAIVKEAYNTNKLVAAICAGPTVLSDAGILKNKNCTIYPGMEEELEKGGENR
jgi:protein deglycase